MISRDQLDQDLSALRARIAGLRSRRDALHVEHTLKDTIDALQVVLGDLQLADLTLRLKEAELAAAHASEAAGRRRYQDLFEFAPDAYFVIDVSGFILEANRAAAALLDVAPAALVGTPLGRYIAEDGRARLETELELLRSHDRLWDRSVRVRSRSGRRIEAAMTGGTIRDAVGRLVGYRLLIRDVTERRQAEDDRVQLEDQLRQAQKMEAVGTLAGGIAHDFNNLLTTILGYSELLLDQLSVEHPHRADVEEIRRAGERASSLTRQLLAFSRKQIVEPQVLNLNPLVRDGVKMLERVIGENIELAVNLDPELWPIKADGGQVEQVILNLAVNARDAMPDGGRLVIETANVVMDEVSAGRRLAVSPGPYVMLGVTDSGTGIDAAVLPRIFEPFFTTKDTGKGTGLGLSTVYGIVKQCGGDIVVHSEPGAGAAFKLYFPRTSEAAAQAQPPASGRPAAGTETILLVEDDAAVRTFARRVLERDGYTVLEAGSAEEAVRRSDSFATTIHLLVTDVIMPGASGRTLAEVLASRRPDMRVLYMSGYTDDDIAHHGVVDPGIALIPKPFTPHGLLRKIREVLDLNGPAAAAAT